MDESQITDHALKINIGGGKFFTTFMIVLSAVAAGGGMYFLHQKLQGTTFLAGVCFCLALGCLFIALTKYNEFITLKSGQLTLHRNLRKDKTLDLNKLASSSYVVNRFASLYLKDENGSKIKLPVTGAGSLAYKSLIPRLRPYLLKDDVQRDSGTTKFLDKPDS